MDVDHLDIRVDEHALRDLERHLDHARLPPGDDDSWAAGTNPSYLRDLLHYWRTDFDWRAQEAALAAFAHYTTTFAGTKIHFIYERGRGPAPMPLVLTHGFPDSFYRFHKVIPLLADPAAHGGDPRDAFDVIVPSLPGFAFSGPPGKHADIFHVANLWHELATDVLGYHRYGAHGGDWGSTVTEHLGRDHRKAVIGIHMTDIPFWHAFRRPRHPTADESRYLDAIAGFQEREGAYAMIQGSRPGTLADGLEDSPVGLLAWLVDFYERWSDCHGDIRHSFTKDELLTSVMIYWATGTIRSSFQPYVDITHAGARRWITETVKQRLGSAKVPAGFAMFPKDLSSPPREWAERFFDVQRWTRMARGGHFAALEEPDLLVDDLRAFFRPLRAREARA